MCKDQRKNLQISRFIGFYQQFQQRNIVESIIKFTSPQNELVTLN